MQLQVTREPPHQLRMPCPLLQEFLGEPGGSLSHQLLHTTYINRSTASQPTYTAFQRMDEPCNPKLQQAAAAGRGSSSSALPGTSA